MEKDRLFNFNYPLRSQTEIEMEKKIKQELRNIAYNHTVPREVERYTDKYVDTVSYDDIMSTLSIELMGPELMKMYGQCENRETAVVVGEYGDHSESKEEREIDERSFEGGDDYSEYFNEEDELVDGEEEDNSPLF